MRKVTFGVASSLDNFIARTDHATDWLVWDQEVAATSSAYWRTIDTVIMGRKTYQVAVELGTTAYPGAVNYVVSSTMREAPDPRVTIVSAEPVEFLRDLKGQKGKGICVMGGGQLAHAFLEADLIDEIGLNIHPVLLGSGVPLFLPMARQVNLRLVASRRFKSGSLLVRFRVEHPNPPTRLTPARSSPGSSSPPAPRTGGRRGSGRTAARP